MITSDTRRSLSVPKSETSRRTVSLPKHVVTALRAHIEAHGLGEDGLVFSGPTGRPLSRTRFRSRTWTPTIELARLRHECRKRGLSDAGTRTELATRLKDAGHDVATVLAGSAFPVPRFHDLRHTHVALLIAGSVPVNAISTASATPRSPRP